MQTKQHPYKYTLGAVFIGVFSVALLLFTVVYFMALTVRQKSSQKEMILAYTASKFDTVNTDLLTIFNAFSHLQKSQELQRFGESKTRQEMYLNAIAAQKEIASGTLASHRLDYYSIAAIYMRGDDTLVLLPTSSTSLDLFAQRIGTTGDEIRRSYAELCALPYGHNLLLSGDPNASGMINYLTLQTYNDGRLLFVLSIDRRNFKETFGELPCSDWVICADDTVLVGQNDDPTSYAVITRQIHDHGTELTPTLSALGFQIGRDNVMGAQFSEIGWSFYASYSPKLFDGSDLAALFLLPLVCLIAASILLARKLYHRLYAPVEELLLRMGGSTDGQTNEFEYIWDQTSQISRKAQQLDVYLSRSQKRLTEQVIKNALLDGSFSDEESAAGLSGQSFVVALVEPAEEILQDDTFADAKLMLRGEVRKLPDQYYISMGDAGFALVTVCSETRDAGQRIQELLSRTGLSVLVQLRIALSSPAEGLKNLHMLMEQCNHLMEYRYNLPNKMFITAEDVAAIYYKGYYYPLKVETNLVQMTLSGKEGALALLEELMHENLVNKILSPENKRSFAFALVSTINRIYQELQLEDRKEYPSVNELLECQDTDLLLQKIRAAFARILWTTSNREENLKEDVGQNMMEYIRANYMHDISLDDMAESLNISPKYCSALFKKQTGQTFKKVLNEYRIERAKTLLMQKPDTKVGDLAVQMGFSSANTFIQVFKQYTGTTPRQFATHNGKGSSF